jgi:translation initiation factor IF-2
MRSRGISAADLAILVVAADNGVQPQPIEALERAKQAGIPIIVAINKIDRASPKQVEAVRAELSRRGLMPEEWGGDTIFVPISALTGEGVEHLLEMVVLRAQLAGLQAFTDVPGVCYVLESRLEKGRGPVANVICRNGILRVGDNFLCGNQQGRVSSLYNTVGASVGQVGPSEPVQIAGFSELPRAGEVLRVVTEAELRAAVRQARSGEGEQRSHVSLEGLREGAIRVVLKTDTVSSREVLITALEKLSATTYAGIAILSSGVGPIFESDVELAADTGAYVYGLHVKVDQKTARLAQDLGVKIYTFDVIYKLLEQIEELAQRGRPVKKVIKKIGEALVLKIFDIKKLGIVAGARIVDGSCSKTSSVKIYRSGHLVGKGTISSLQRDKNAVKEVRKGFECAFMVNGFSEWQVDDRVECYDEVKEVE